MSAREAVAAAVNAAAITGVSGSQWPPSVRRPGSCWAQFAGATPVQYGNARVELDGLDWDVILVLPADNPATTARAADNWLRPLLDALAPLGRLGEISPTALEVGEGGKATVPALRIRLTTDD